MNIRPFVYCWLALVVVVLGIALYRLMMGMREDETLHLADSEASSLAQQSITGKKIGKLERWGKLLTWITALYGFVLLVIYLYGVWTQAG